MNLPLVSIIVPVYNTGSEAVKLIKNILSSSYDNLEIVVVDDGSTDESFKVLKNIKSRKVKIYHKENGGPSSARNYGIIHATGKYILFVDSDDKIEKTYVEKLVKTAEENNDALIMTGVKFHNVKNKVAKEDFLTDFPKKNSESIKTYVLRSLLKDGRMYPVFNKIFRAELIKEYELKFDENMSFGEDTKFVLDYIKTGLSDAKFVLEPLYTHNFNTKTSTASKMEGDWNNWRKCYKNLKNWVGKANIKQRFLLSLLYIRWRYSWIKARIISLNLF